MLDDPRLLVVDDEEAICEGCRRIFSRQGFQVEKANDAMEGLTLATERNYAAVLLDIKMPNLDGIQFLERIRTTKPELPVILMTGYPSVPNAISAVRLGASGYVTKPFTPEEISQAVYKYAPKSQAFPAAPSADGWTTGDEATHFFGPAWFRLGQDGTARAGIMLRRSQAATVKSVRLPRIGEVVYQGLPLASLTLADGSEVVVPAPLSGLVLAVNESLSVGTTALATDPCGRGWIASISPTRFEEAKHCTVRRVILFNTDATSAKAQQEKLTALGYTICTAARWDDVARILESGEYGVVVMDATGFAEKGPGLVAQINTASSAVKVVLVAGADSRLEAAYRAQRIFYYAVEPFADNEIAEILAAAFRPQATAARPADRRQPGSGPLCSVLITNRNGKKVRLVIAPRLLRRESGLGAAIRQRLLDRLFPMESVSGDADLDAANILKMAEVSDHLVVLLTKDLGRLPGSLVRDTKAQFVSISDDSGAGKVTFLVVQPGANGGLDELAPETVAALAEHVVADMAGY